MNNSEKENYKYFINVNQWALKKFFGLYKINKESYKKLKSNHYVLLFLLVELYIVESFTKKEINGLTYTYISTGLIVDNLPLFFIANNYGTNKKEYNRLNGTGNSQQTCSTRNTWRSSWHKKKKRPENSRKKKKERKRGGGQGRKDENKK